MTEFYHEFVMTEGPTKLIPLNNPTSQANTTLTPSSSNKDNSFSNNKKGHDKKNNNDKSSGQSKNKDPKDNKKQQNKKASKREDNVIFCKYQLYSSLFRSTSIQL